MIKDTKLKDLVSSLVSRSLVVVLGTRTAEHEIDLTSECTRLAAAAAVAVRQKRSSQISLAFRHVSAGRSGVPYRSV